MKDYQLLDFNESMNVVISNNATEYKPIVIRYGIMYDPADGFRPINAPAKTKKLSDSVAAEAQTMIDNARKSWKPSVKQESAKPAMVWAKRSKFNYKDRRMEIFAYLCHR